MSVSCSLSEEDFVTEEQLEVARNRADYQATSRKKADSFVFSSATKMPPDSGESKVAFLDRLPVELGKVHRTISIKCTRTQEH